MSNTIRLMHGILGVTMLAITAATQAAPAAEKPREEYLADLRYRFLHVQQGWGELGINKCAHARDVPAEPLRIGSQDYARGLGHHASGQIVIDLAGEYARFESLVGVQTMSSGTGSVIFKVFVDDEMKFDSGVMKPDTPAKPVSVDLAKARELRLVVEDAGDGITCDCANWVDARLVRAERVVFGPEDRLEVGRFAATITCDPNRTEGARSTRIQEYRADDIYLETPVQPNADGVYEIAAGQGKPGCIGLKWMERRRIIHLGFVPAQSGFDPADVQVQCWVGGTAWQGAWKILAGQWSSPGDECAFVPDWSSVPDARGATRKVRFIFVRPAAIKHLFAYSAPALSRVMLQLELEKPLGDGPGTVEVYNGSLEPMPGNLNRVRAEWRQNEPLLLAVKCIKQRPWTGETTSLRIRLPGAEFAVGVDDVLKNGCVYVRDLGLFVTQNPVKIGLADYKRRIAGQQTVLEEVRTRPDQTFAQATAIIHNPKQDLLPTLLSLACDNHKMIAHRSGEVQFSAAPETDDKHVSDLLDQSGRIAPKFGSGKNEKLTRRLDGDWMPVPIVTVEEGGISYRQRTFVAPLDGKDGKPVGVMEFTIENGSSAAADASLELSIWANAAKDDVAELTTVPGGAVAFRRGRLVAFVQAGEARPLEMELTAGGVRLSGNLGPRVTSRLVVFIPMAVLKTEQHTQFTNADELLRATKDHWARQLAKAMQVEVPDPLVAKVIKASQAHCLVAARNEQNGERIAAWIASVAYGPLESEAHSVIRGMDSLGHHDFARKSLDFFISRYNAEGFLTTGYTIMGTGWHLWTLGEHYRLTGNKAWLEKVAPQVGRVCDWIVRQRQKTMEPAHDGSKPPEYGFAPPGVMADWNAFAYYFCLNGYFCAGLRDAADALADVGVAEAPAWREAANQYHADLLRGYNWTRAIMPVYRLRNGTSVPGYPSQLHGPGPTANFFPGEDANRSWCYDVELGSHHLVPFGIIDPASRETAWMMDHMEDVQFLSEGWFDFPADRSATDPFNYGGFAKVQPYYCRNGEINALRDDVKPFVRTYFNSLASLLNYENLSLQEHFAGVAAWNKTHETGYFLHQTKLMLVMERGEELWLAPFVTNTWLKDGLTVAAANAPTRFGPVSFRVTSAAGQGHIDATVDVPTRRSPKQIILRLRHPEGKPIRKVTVNGQAHEDFDPAKEIVRIAPSQPKITVRASY